MLEWGIHDIDCWATDCTQGLDVAGYCPKLCGSFGYCCSTDPDKSDKNGDCPSDAIQAMHSLTDKTYHICVQIQISKSQNDP